jgi:hypothetical protein
MSQPNDDITNQPNDYPRTTDVTNELPVDDDAYETLRIPPPPKSKFWLYVLLGVGIPVLLIFVVGLVITAITKVREAAARVATICNSKQIVLGMHNCASNTSSGDIPPAYGPFPAGSTTNQSFFVSLLPYIEQNSLYKNQVITTPVKTYIAAADPNNPGTNGLISYGSNANLLTVGGSPTLPGSFGGRTSGVIVVFERTAKSGATWSSSNSYLIDSNGSSSPEFGPAASWSNYGSKATALTSAGCIVGLGDGSSRVVTQSNANAGWAWAMNPQNPPTQPPGW